MVKLRTVQNMSTGITSKTVRAGVPSMLAWIINFTSFTQATPREKYGHFLQKYNLRPGQYIRSFPLNSY
uniref:Uncharacterized protein n=1 Tax=viral metagenome TaxID=1070528 RepID=A0A6C0HS96_9ZZZZ